MEQTKSTSKSDVVDSNIEILGLNSSLWFVSGKLPLLQSSSDSEFQSMCFPNYAQNRVVRRGTKQERCPSTCFSQ